MTGTIFGEERSSLTLAKFDLSVNQPKDDCRRDILILMFSMNILILVESDGRKRGWKEKPLIA